MGEITEKDMETLKKNLEFRNKVNNAIESVFGDLVSKEACNALYILAECMYSSLTSVEAQWVFDKSEDRRNK